MAGNEKKTQCPFPATAQTTRHKTGYHCEKISPQYFFSLIVSLYARFLKGFYRVNIYYYYYFYKTLHTLRYNICIHAHNGPVAMSGGTRVFIVHIYGLYSWILVYNVTTSSYTHICIIVPLPFTGIKKNVIIRRRNFITKSFKRFWCISMLLTKKINVSGSLKIVR